MLRNRLPSLAAFIVLTTLACGPSAPKDAGAPPAMAAPVTPVPSGIPSLTWYLDTDGDGYGTPQGGGVKGVDQPTGYVDNQDDCDDSDPLVHPGATERGGNGVDDDCDGRDDEWDDFTPAP